MKKIIILPLVVCVYSFGFDLGSIFSESSQILGQNSSKSSISNDYKVKGLKKALDIGTKYAINTLSKDGFLKHSAVKIPLPKSLATVGSMASKVGAEKYVNDFVKTMNLAAGDAVIKTAPIFAKAIQNLSVKDASRLLAGNSSAITDYFKQNTKNELVRVVKPIVAKATKKNNLTSSYTALVNVSKTGGINKSLGKAKDVASAFGLFGKDDFPSDNEDLDSYVTRKTVDGMFYMIAKEEQKIRANPLSYGSSIIKKVFGK